MNIDLRLVAGVLAVLLLASGSARGQEPSSSPPAVDEPTNDAPDPELPRRQLVKWNEYHGPWLTFRLGVGLLYEGTAHSQDEESQQQLELTDQGKLRDARFLLSGRLLPRAKRELIYKAGVMYDGPTGEWFIRETGLMVAVPELWGHFFVGRTKEGFSMNKVMVGYAGWTQERSTVNDAMIPILADGIKWLGWLPKQRILWNLGAYGDYVSEGEGFSTYDNQFVARLAWLPILSDEKRTLLHLGMSGRYGKPNEGTLKLRSRPESFPTEFFVDTGDFACEDTKMLGFEGYYRAGPLLLGTEYSGQWANAPESGDPFFHGGEVVAIYMLTGETRSYNTRGGFFNAISPAKSVFSGGPGAWEAVFRASYIDLDDGTLRGGRFWRLTPMVNWHLADFLRLELTYGYGKLQRFDLNGGTHFFQSRIQLWF